MVPKPVFLAGVTHPPTASHVSFLPAFYYAHKGIDVRDYALLHIMLLNKWCLFQLLLRTWLQGLSNSWKEHHLFQFFITNNFILVFTCHKWFDSCFSLLCVHGSCVCQWLQSCRWLLWPARGVQASDYITIISRLVSGLVVRVYVCVCSF